MSDHPLANLRRIGGEMFAWSDWDLTRSAKVAKSGALAPLLAEISGPGRAVLVAGPHDDHLLSRLLDSGATITYLLRSVDDAERVAKLFPHVTVVCGSIAKLSGEARFDLVSAMDGLDRLSSVEGEHLADAEVLRSLTGLLAPGGRLALMHDNLFGIHHSVELTPGRHLSSDGAWYPPAEHDELRPATLAQLKQQLAGEGLSVAAAYAVYPTPQTPTVLIGQSLLGDTSSPLRGQLGAVLSQEFTAAYRDTPVLSDPRRLISRALKAGAEGVVAPAWLTVVQRGNAEPPMPERGIVVGEGNGQYAYEYSISAGQARLEVLAAPVDVEEHAGLRRVTDLSAYPPAAGRVFEERLFQLCAGADLRELRTELSRFVTWLESQANDGTIAGPVALATSGTVLDRAGEFHLVMPRWQPVEPVAVATVVTRALWDFAIRLIGGNHPHPWQITYSAVELTETLTSMLGRVLRDEELAAAQDLEIAYRTADERLSQSQQQDRRNELATVYPGKPVDLAGYRELADALWLQQYQVTHLRETLTWTETIIDSRDAALSQMDWEIQLYKSSGMRKILVLIRTIYRVSRRDLGRIVRKLRKGRGNQGEQQ